MVQEIKTLDEFKEKVLNDSKPVILDFWAPWCGPCKMMTPVFESLAGEMDSVDFVKINIDEAEEITEKFSVMSVPTLLLIKDGQVVDQKSGAMNKEQLKEFIEEGIQ